MLWVYGILGVFISLAIVQLMRFLIGMKEKSRVPTGIQNNARAGSADFARRFPPRWGLWMRERAISHLLTLTAPLWMYTILWLLRPHIFGPLYSQYSGWLWTAYIVFVVGLWSFRDTAPSLRKSRMAFYIFVLLLLGGVFLVDRYSDTPVLPGADSTFKSGVQKKCRTIDDDVDVWHSTVLCAGDELLIRVPKANEGAFSNGFTAQDGVYVTVMPSTLCTGMRVLFYQKDHQIRDRKFGPDMWNDWGSGESVALRYATTLGVKQECYVTVYGTEKPIGK